MKIVKCTFVEDKWGFYITPLIGYSNTERGRNFWIGWFKWLWTIELTNENKTIYKIKD